MGDMRVVNLGMINMRVVDMGVTVAEVVEMVVVDRAGPEIQCPGQKFKIVPLNTLITVTPKQFLFFIK